MKKWMKIAFVSIASIAILSGGIVAFKYIQKYRQEQKILRQEQEKRSIEFIDSHAVMLHVESYSVAEKAMNAELDELAGLHSTHSYSRSSYTVYYNGEFSSSGTYSKSKNTKISLEDYQELRYLAQNLAENRTYEGKSMASTGTEHLKIVFYDTKGHPYTIYEDGGEVDREYPGDGSKFQEIDKITGIVSRYSV